MTSKVTGILKILIIGYVVTAMLLLALTLCVYKLGWGNSQIDIGVIVVYGVATLLGGFLLAFRERKRRLVCGIGFGLLYFLVLGIVSFAVSAGSIDVAGMLKALITCVVCGGIGGILVK